MSKKTWSKPTVTDTKIKDVLVSNSTKKGTVTSIFLMLVMFLNAQTVTISEGCSSGSVTDYVLPVIAVNDSGYNVYQSGNRLLEFNVISKRWEYSVGGSILFFNKVKSQKPLPPCSFKFDYSHVASCADTTFNVLSDCTILPVGLLYFTASHTEGGVILKWKTASEQNNSHFEIEMSTDARHFEKVSIVSAKGAGVYEYTHDIKKSGIMYYRLKQVDTDGKATTYKVISVSKSTPSVWIDKGVVYGDGKIEVYNLSGQLLASGSEKLIIQAKGFLVIRANNQVFKYYN